MTAGIFYTATNSVYIFNVTYNTIVSTVVYAVLYCVI